MAVNATAVLSARERLAPVAIIETNEGRDDGTDVFIIILYNKKKNVSFSLLYFCLFGCKFEVWRKKTHLILFQVGFSFIIFS
jgi:hypothetical protein